MGYERLYADFDSPLGRRLRAEAYGEDIGQQSWVTVEELRHDIPALGLGPASRLLDLGCGPAGPLTFVMQATGCSAVGLDISPAALEVATRRASTAGVQARLQLLPGHLDAPLPLADASLDATVCLDAILHARDRCKVFREVRRVLIAGGRFLFTDAAVLTGAISNAEVATRCAYGLTQLSAPGFNERQLEAAGLALLQTENRTADLLRNAKGRLAARKRLREELLPAEGVEEFERQRLFLEAVVELAERGALSRFMYLARA